MKITSSYKVEIIGNTGILKPTVKIYREALSYLIEVYNSEWDELSKVERKLERASKAERLVHSTKLNEAKYDFDKKFYKMPTYLRRAAINAALGIVSGYRSNLSNWENAPEPKGKPPKLQVKHIAMPTFYNKDMFRNSASENECFIKLYLNNDWKWFSIKLKPTDVKYIKKYWSHVTPSAPTLVKTHKKYFLCFAFEENIALSNKSIADQLVCSVDLGVNIDAVCSIINSKGTVLARKFINFPSEKDHLMHVLNRIKKHQRKNSSKGIKPLWEYARRLNDELAKKVSLSIVDFATQHSADVIVFEHLDFSGKKTKGSKKQKLHMWKKNSIQDYVTHKAHRCGIRVSRICAWGTSKLAYDGSGELTRNKENASLATFKSGKQYNCDLSASYNIGARYFIRELLKPFPEKEKSLLQAKVPEVERRTSCTLNTLIKLNKYLDAA